MFNELKALLDNDTITKNDIMTIINKYARGMTVYDEMIASTYLREEGRFIQKKFREKYLKVTIKYFLLRLNKIKKDNNDYPEEVDKEQFRKSIETLKAQYSEEELSVESSNDKTALMYTIISIYTTYILEEPIHPINTPFPADQHIVLQNGKYYCPVKHNQLDNPNALCQLCIAIDMEDKPEVHILRFNA